MPPPPKPIVALLLALLTSTFAIPAQLIAQQPTIPRITILLDPAHGGPDPGARLANNTLEKDQTLAFATRLRTLLTANSFPVISTRDADPAVPFPTDQRAEIANHAHPAICLILHATATGSGVHIITSALAPPENPDADSPRTPIPWDTAQSASIPQSRLLANDLGLALLHAKLPVLLTRAATRPLDNLTCPAVAIEIAPLPDSPVTDPTYQQHIAEAITTALTSWRSRITATTGAAR